jgi:hypothetical protein
MSQSGNSKHGSAFQIVIWYADNPNDTTLTTNKILWEARVESGLEDVKLFGGFDRKDIQMMSYADSVKSTINIPLKVVQLPRNIDMRRVVVRVRTSEAGTAGADPYKPIIPMSFIQNIYPNPVSEKLTLLFGTPTPQNYALKLISGDMQTTKEIIIPQGIIKIDIDAESMPEGIFFIHFNNGALIDKRRLLKIKK